MSNLIPFDFDGDAVRVVMQGAAPWFIFKDLCRCLDLAWKGSDSTGTPLDEDERSTVVADTPGGPQKVSAVSESGLYSLIFTSRKPEAKRFRKWVTSEVLPTIRTTGRYEAQKFAPAMPSIPASLTLKPSLRGQAMRAAVQTARLSGGTEEDVKRLYEEFCGLFAARPDRPNLRDGLPFPENQGLVEEFITEEMTIVDIDPSIPTPRHMKTQAKDLYEMFRVWCRGRGTPSRDIPTHNLFGRSFKIIPGVERTTPKNKVFYNIVPRP